MTRDARHLALPQVGAGGQQRIANGRVLLIGVGGIGCAAATAQRWPFVWIRYGENNWSQVLGRAIGS